MMKDQFEECEMCGSKLCYHQVHQDGSFSKTCFSCGMSTNSSMMEGGAADLKAQSTTPELYKDLRIVGKDGYVWYPATITLPERGMVFLDGTNKNDIGWASVKMVPIKKSESSKFPKGQTHKMDMNTFKKFGKDQFTEAADSIGFFG
jgi:hypothetical protein